MAEAIRVQGLKELRADLKKLEASAPKELNKISKEAASIVSTAAKGMVPVRSGRLRGAIRPGGNASGGYVKAGPLVYAPVIHFGWARHNIAPQPFLYDALDARRDEVIRKFEKDVAALVEKTVHNGLE